MEYKLIPTPNEEKRYKAQKELEKLKLVTSPEQFIGLFNSGIISVNNPLVKDVVKAITQAYINVRQFGNKIIVRSEEEVAFDTSIELLKGWRIVSTMKRIALQMLDESFAPDTTLLFYENKPGILHFEGLIEGIDETIHQYWLREKLFPSNASLVNNIFLGKYVFEYDQEEEILGLKLSDVVDIDDSFILETKKDLIARTFEAGQEDSFFFSEDEQH